MSPENPTDPRQALEASLTALLLGELAPDQAQFLREALIRDAELARMHERLKQTIGLVRQVEARPEVAMAAAPEPLRLSEEKREKLLEHFKTTPLVVVAEPQRSRSSWWVMAAAAVVLCFLGVSMLLPALSRAKSKAQFLTAVAPATVEGIEPLSRREVTTTVTEREARRVARLSETEAVRQLDRVASGVSPVPARRAPQANIVLPQDELRRGESLSAAVQNEDRKRAVTWNGDKSGVAGPEPGVAMKYEAPAQSTPMPAAETPTLNFGSAFIPSEPYGTAAPTENADRLQSPGENLRLGWEENRGRAGGLAGGGGMGGGLPQTRGAETLNRDAEKPPVAAFRRRYGLAPTSTATQAGAAVVPSDGAVAPSSGLPLAAARTETETVEIQNGPGSVSATLPGFYYDNTVTLPDDQSPGRGFQAGYYVATNALADARERADHTFTWNMPNERFADAGGRAIFGRPNAPVLGDTPLMGRQFSDYDADAGNRVLAQSEKKVAGQVGMDFFSLQENRSAGGVLGIPLQKGVGVVGGDAAVRLKIENSAKADVLGGKSLGLAEQDLAVLKIEEPPPALQSGRQTEVAKESLVELGKSVLKDRTDENYAKELSSQQLSDSKNAGELSVPRAAAAAAPTKQTLTGITSIEGRGKAKIPALQHAQQAASDVTPAKPATPPPVPQPEVSSSENAFSTFSLNVSDVSFKLAAASLEKGVMPDAASIRSEEFINAFDYRDPEPAPGVPIAFTSERARYPFAQNRDLLRFSLKTAAQGRPTGRALNLVLLVDNSGSMERADRVSILREALRVLAAQLQPQDKLSVVTFSLTPHLWADGVPGNQAARVAEEVAGLTPQGGTNLEEAMKLAYQTAGRHYLAGGINRVVLMTDGAANLGDVNPEALKQSVEAHRKQGIALDCFGIGWEGYNDDLLEVLTRNGDGRYGFINTREEASTEFAGQLAGALRVAASDVKVQVEFNPKRVTAYRQIGYAKHQLTKEQFRDNTVDAAEIGAAESGNALYVVEANPQGEGALATVRARYKVPGTSDYYEHEWTVPYTGGAAPLEQASPAMRLAAAASAFSEWLANSQYAAGVTPDALLNLVRGVPQVYGADTRPQKLEWMIRQANSLAAK